MPVYRFVCTKCGTSFRKLYKAEEFLTKRTATPCPKPDCGYYAIHLQGAATSQAMEVLDDGIRATRLERYADAERLFQERATAHDLKYGNKEPEDE